MRKAIVVSLLLVWGLFVVTLHAYASPTVIWDYAFVNYRPTDDIFAHSGLYLVLGLAATDTNGFDALTASGASMTVESTNSSFPVVQPVNLELDLTYSHSGGTEYREFNTFIQLTDSNQFSSITGRYIFTVTNADGETVASISHDLDKVEIIPLPTALTVSDLSTTPVFSFTDPDPTPNVAGVNRQYRMDIFDSSMKGIFSSAWSSTTSFSVPDGILQPGLEYYFRASSIDIDPSESSSSHVNRESRSNEYISFTPSPVPAPSAIWLLGPALFGLIGLKRKVSVR